MVSKVGDERVLLVSVWNRMTICELGNLFGIDVMASTQNIIPDL